MTNVTILATTLFALIGVVSALCITSNNNGQENFLGMGYPMKWKVFRESRLPSGGFVNVPGNYDALLPPRFSNVDYGANIRYNMPGRSMQAVPKNPLTYGNMAVKKENYSAPSCGPSGANKGSVYGMSGLRNMPQPDYSAPGRKAAESKLQSYEVTSVLPVGTMTELTSSGSVQQPVMYDRFMYANQRSRLREQGDPIRGDLPIAPLSGGWFTPSVNPNVDLRDGALAVMGGINNNTQQQTTALMNAASGGTMDILGGVNYGTMFESSLSQGGATLDVTAFP